MSQVIDDATSAMHDTYDDASNFLDDNDVPLGDFLNEQIARVRYMILLKLMMSLKLKILKHLLELSLLDMNFLRYWKAML